MRQFKSSDYFKQSSDFLGWALILSSSVLLSIWAVKDTIALRNILLGLETILTIIYCYRFYKTNPEILLKNFAPLILLALMLLWVIFHYFFLCRFPEQQLHELTSTWLRSSLAMIVGVGTGIALLRKPNAINFLWIGLLGSFAYLIYQYIPKAIALESFFVPDYVNYIFYGKISGVLAGTVFIAGLLGTMLDTAKRDDVITTAWSATLTFIGLFVSLYVYVFILDARNGVGLEVILVATFCLIMFSRGVLNIYQSVKAKRVNIVGSMVTLLLVIALALLTGWGMKEHMQHNPRWSSIWEDAKTSIQIDKYPNWQDPLRMGYPQNETGQLVKSSNYERLAWVTVGVSKFLPQNPFGLGILKNPFTILLKEYYPNNSGYYIPSTHSAWVEIGLAFGYPGLFLMLGALFSLGYLSLSTKSSFRFTALFFSQGLLCLYAVGEVSSQHAIEMLFFLIAMATALLISYKPKNA